MPDGALKQALSAMSFGVALRDINVDQQTLGRERLPDADSLKSSIAAFYHNNTIEGLTEFWNWGFYESGLQREITQALGSFGELLSDGYSEQLYFYTFKQVPRPNNAPRRILEVGCGRGVGLHFLSRIERESELIGLDLEGGAIARANEQYSRRGSLSYVQGDAEKLPFDDAQFDAVINVESSHNYPNLRGFISEVARVLRPNGYFSHVDVFTDDRLQCMNQCKRDSASELTWLAETEITDRVKEAIRRRMAPGSLFRQQLAHGYRFVPWPMSAAVAEFAMYGYGKSFADRGHAAWSRLLPWRRHHLNMARTFQSYWHTLAQKPAQ